MSDEQIKDDEDVEGHRHSVGATDEGEDEGDDVEAHRHSVGRAGVDDPDRSSIGRNAPPKHDI